MKLTAVAVAILASSLAFAKEAAPDPCSAWVLDGYRPNMTREDALAVRPASQGTYHMFEVEEPARFHGTIFFDNSGFLESYSSALETKTTAAETIAAWTAKLGPPVVLNLPIKADDDRAKVTAWLSKDCGGVIYVLERLVDPEGANAEQSFVLVSLGSRATLEGFEKQRQHFAAAGNQ